MNEFESTIGKASTGASGIILRDLDSRECFWLDKKVKKGTVVFRYEGPTYGCITPSGVPVCLEKQEYPFFEVPRDAVLFEE